MDKQCKHNNNGWCEQKGKSCLTEENIKECSIYECDNPYKTKENKVYLDGKQLNTCCDEIEIKYNCINDKINNIYINKKPIIIKGKLSNKIYDEQI